MVSSAASTSDPSAASASASLSAAVNRTNNTITPAASQRTAIPAISAESSQKPTTASGDSTAASTGVTSKSGFKRQGRNTPAATVTLPVASASSTLSLLLPVPVQDTATPTPTIVSSSNSYAGEPPSLTRSPRLPPPPPSPSLAEQSLRKNQLKDKSAAGKEMLLLHATGSVKVGEIMRYTITYTPMRDSVLPPPSALHLRIKNTEPIPMRAAYLHGPYVLYVSAKSSKFDQWTPVHDAREEGGYPEFDPNLRPGGTWECQLPIPRSLRNRVMEKERSRRLSSSGGKPTIGQRVEKEEEKEESITWIVEVVSQMLFSSTSRINFDLLLARDERSLSTFSAGTGLDEGSYSRAISYKVQNTEQLWNTPPFPGDVEPVEPESTKRPKKNKGPKKVHLVVITHGLHSNTGADMLYLKENIDKASARAVESARKRRRAGRKKEKEMMEERKRMEEEAHMRQKRADVMRRRQSQVDESLKEEVLSTLKEEDEEMTKSQQLAPVTTIEHKMGPADSDSESDEDDDEQVITRGFHENVCRTERGIKYLGKRLARYVLALTHRNRPFPPSLRDKKEMHKSSTFPLHLHRQDTDDVSKKNKEKLPPLKYKVTSISFIGHSLGGLVQTYAIAYIHAHSPTFFKEVEPVNFIALASPFLGLSNENPIYIRFALDFGVVGKTGQDLGLSWRPPNVAASALSAFSSVTASHQKENEMAGTKPLLRILPTGPAKVVLHMFRNRTVYANVVNDGIVPLRTSCLLFLDWKGLGRVEKARRQAEGPVGQVSGLVGWGWGQLISGQGERTHKRSWSVSSKKSDNTVQPGQVGEAPRTDERPKSNSSSSSSGEDKRSGNNPPPNPFTALLTLFRPHAAKKKAAIYKRSQIMPSPTFPSETPTSPVADRKLASSPDKMSPAGSVTAAGADVDEMDPQKNHLGQTDDEAVEDVIQSPPRTTLLEAAGDVLNPPLPPLEYIINPEKRQRTIFHDRVYHPEDIPPVPLRTRRTLSRAGSSFGPGPLSPTQPQPPKTPTNAADESIATQSSASPNENGNTASSPGNNNNNTNTSPVNNHNTKSNMRVEEKIARAYHDGISWRKVLVRLEPDAHNNIIVRREFSNAYGWPVVKHLCDTHFEDTYESRMRDDEEEGEERALDIGVGGWKGGREEVTHGEVRHEVLHAKINMGEAVDVDVDVPLSPPKMKEIVSDGEDDKRLRFRRRPSAKRTLSFKRNRSASPTNPMEDSGVWSDSAFNVSDEEEDAEEVKRNEEERRLRQIDDFLGKGNRNKAKPCEASVSVVSGDGGKGGGKGSGSGFLGFGGEGAVWKLRGLQGRGSLEVQKDGGVGGVSGVGDEGEEGIARKIARLSFSSTATAEKEGK